MKTAVLIDSNAGIKKDEAKELGIYLVSTPIIIDGEVYFEEENLTQEQFYEALMSDKDITSSMPSPGDVMDMWDELLKEYDEVAYIPLSSGLSNSCHAAIQLSDEYDGPGVLRGRGAAFTGNRGRCTARLRPVRDLR